MLPASDLKQGAFFISFCERGTRTECANYTKAT